MFGYLTDIDRTWNLFEHLRRQMDQALEDYDRTARFVCRRHGTLAADLHDNGDAYVFTAEVPGLAEKDIDISLNHNVLTVSGKRSVDAPEGYRAHRQERGSLEFRRSYALPAQVDPEKVSATLEHGVLTVTLDKAPEQKPRQIAVKAS